MQCNVCREDVARGADVFALLLAALTSRMAGTRFRLAQQTVTLLENGRQTAAASLYVAPFKEFHKHLHEFEMTKIRFVCPE